MSITDMAGLAPAPARHSVPHRHAPKAKAHTAARTPYALPRLLDPSTAASPGSIEIYCQTAIREAWAAGERGEEKAARKRIANWRLTPADIAAMACWLADYNRGGNWPPAQDAQKSDWLSAGSGCCERFGTVRDTHLAAWSALRAALSIIVDVPLEHTDDADELLLTLLHVGWRHVPRRQQARLAERMARYVARRITADEFSIAFI